MHFGRCPSPYVDAVAGFHFESVCETLTMDMQLFLSKAFVHAASCNVYRLDCVTDDVCFGILSDERIGLLLAGAGKRAAQALARGHTRGVSRASPPDCTST